MPGKEDDDDAYAEDFEEEAYDDDFDEQPDGSSPKAGRVSLSLKTATGATADAPTSATIATEPLAPCPPNDAASRPASAAAEQASVSAQQPQQRETGPLWDDIQPDDVKIGRQLGGGGFAVVFEGSWKGRRVAVKQIVDPSIADEDRATFMAELHTMAALRHDNIVRCLAACTVPPRQCYVMELCGPSLFDVLHRLGRDASGGGSPAPVPLHQALAWAADAAAAIAYLHSRRPAVIHRDIKSANLVVSGPGGRSCKCTDFGLVSTRITSAGTPSYMSPELLAGKPFNRSVDTYAFGILLWELLSRQIPFAGWRPADIQKAACSGTRPDVKAVWQCPAVAGAVSSSAATRSVVEAAIELILRCWADAPTSRPDMATVHEELLALQKAKLPAPAAGSGAEHSSAAAKADVLDAAMGKAR